MCCIDQFVEKRYLCYEICRKVRLVYVVRISPLVFPTAAKKIRLMEHPTRCTRKEGCIPCIVRSLYPVDPRQGLPFSRYVCIYIDTTYIYTSSTYIQARSLLLSPAREQSKPWLKGLLEVPHTDCSLHVPSDAAASRETPLPTRSTLFPITQYCLAITDRYVVPVRAGCVGSSQAHTSGK